jgi:uncharacterized protein (DUF1684 family)
MQPGLLTQALEVADWRRRVAVLYAQVRSATSPLEGWARWRQGRDRLFVEHPQSPLPQQVRDSRHTPVYFEYDPTLRVTVDVEECEPTSLLLPSSEGDELSATRIGTIRFDIAGQRCALQLYSLSGYAGGLFVSFRDATSGTETYGAGRYLLDTVKGADLGTDEGRLVLDFNFAYQPSCSYDECWSCPLPPGENWLAAPVRAGERLRQPGD